MEHEILRRIIWTKDERKSLKDIYFEVLRITDRYYELRSRNTGHQWIIIKQRTGNYSIILYHKHTRDVAYYHRQCGTHTVKQAITFIIISVFGILCYLDIIPLRKQYYIFKIQFYGKYTRFKVRVVSAVDKVLRYWDI